MVNKDFNTILEIIEAFPTQEACVKHLEHLRWNGNPTSPFDPTSKVYKCSNNRYRCKNTSKYFNVRTATLFDNTKVPLQKWFVAIWLETSHKKGISSVQLAKDIGVTQKTAWFMLQRIRNCFGEDNEGDLSGDVEVDETYVGGKNKNRHKDKKVKNSQGRSYKDKTPVFGIVERGGKLISKVVKDVKGNTLKSLIFDYAEPASTIHSDEWWAYNGLSRFYNHLVVEHGKGQYVDDNGSHCNTMEGFWSHLKRGITGIYHWVSRKHLQLYVNEFVFRYNTRHLTEGMRFNFMLSFMENRLTYKELTQ